MPDTDHRSTLRVIEIMELLAFSENAGGMTLTEIATALKCPKSSISPILHTLLKNGYLSLNAASSGYIVGRRAYEVGSTYINDNDFYSQALAIMRKIVDACSETCHLAELNGSSVLYLLKIDSPHTIRMFSAPGKKLPAYATALGKALLSSRTREELDSLFPDGLRRITGNTITDVNALYAQLLDVRRDGFAFEKEENAEFVQCIAVPICRSGAPALAMSVSVPTFRYSDEKETLIKKLLVDAKREMEKII